MKNLNKKTLALIGALIPTLLFGGCGDEPIPYRQEDHGRFTEEFAPHENVNGWWYVTGYLTDVNNPDNIYSFQYTQFNFRNAFFPDGYVLQLALTNLQTGEHLSESHFSPSDKWVYANREWVAFLPFSLLQRGKNSLHLLGKMENATVILHFNLGKDGSWHGDNGVLVMGLPDDPIQRTVYYSYTNMPTYGKITLVNDNGEETTIQVEGKSWFDRQWGPFRMFDASSSYWEWFSLRFFDDEEVMLFSFPQHPYQDGTYIDVDAHTHRLQNYTYVPTGYIKTETSCYSFGWELTMPGIKEEHYRIEPLVDSQTQTQYFELTAAIINDDDERVGYAFVELLPFIRTGMCE